ncbi:MAG TPA: acyltransferase [Acidimicrobiales bacterium]
MRPARASRDDLTVTSGHFPCLDGYRALAALAVVMYHVLGEVNPGWLPPVLRSFNARLGNYGVAVFFLISGLLLYRPFVLAHLEDRPMPRTLSFYRRRFLRIFPAYWLALTALFFVFRFRTLHRVSGALTYYGLVQNYRPDFALGGLAVAWTLCIEVSFYLALPLIAWLISRPARRPGADLHARLRAQLLGLGALYLVAVNWRIFRILVLPDRSQAGLWLPATLDWFALGMLLAVGNAWGTVTGRLPALVTRLASAPWLCWLFAAQLYWVTMQLHLPPGYALPTPFQTMARYFLNGLSAFLLLLPGVFGPQGEGLIRRALRSWPLASLGVVSYGLYLWHTLWLRQVRRWSVDGWFGWSFLSVMSAVLVLTIATAALSYFAVERPLVRLKGRRRSTPYRSAQEPERPLVEPVPSGVA